MEGAQPECTPDRQYSATPEPIWPSSSEYDTNSDSPSVCVHAPKKKPLALRKRLMAFQFAFKVLSSPLKFRHTC